MHNWICGKIMHVQRWLQNSGTAICQRVLKSPVGSRGMFWYRRVLGDAVPQKLMIWKLYPYYNDSWLGRPKCSWACYCAASLHWWIMAVWLTNKMRMCRSLDVLMFRVSRVGLRHWSSWQICTSAFYSWLAVCTRPTTSQITTMRKPRAWWMA